MLMIVPFAIPILLYVAYRLYAHSKSKTGLASLPGPRDPPSWFYGYATVLWSRPPGDLHQDWVREYGHVYSWPSLLCKPSLVTTDPRALTHILSRSDVYEKSASLRSILEAILGAGLVTQEGAVHRRQRKALNPAFGSNQLRALTGIMLDKANELCDVLDNALPPSTKATEFTHPLDILPFLSQCTLDIIGLAGFGYNFASLSSTSEAQSELYEAFQTSMSFAENSPIKTALTFLIPGFSSLPTPNNLKMKKAMHTMERIGGELLQERKASMSLDEKPGSEKPKDLLSLLVRANILAASSDRLDDKEVLGQIPTFLGAGHETTSTLLSWILMCLSQYPDIQDRLRTECLASPLSTAPNFNPPLTTDELAILDKLPLLDAVVRETLRLHPPAIETARVASANDTVPLSQPFTDRYGVVRHTIDVRKGDDVVIPIASVNRSEKIWGADAMQWRPNRWMEGIPEEAKKVPGVWGNVLTFIAGPHGCIGYKFSLYETKLILHALICRFRFELGNPVENIVGMHGIIIRPGLRDRKEAGTCMMLKVTRADA